MIKNNENKSICFGCGQCCKSLPGIVSPSDLKEVTVESLTDLFESGYQFDYWEGNLTGNPEHDDITFFYLRPQTKNSVNKIVDASWGGECVFLNDDGCSKSFEERPSQCRALTPSKDGNCYLDKKYEKKIMIEEWLPYNEIIIETIDKISKD